MLEKRIITKSSQETFDFGKQLGEVIDFPLIIFLQGQMGAGKTLFSKGFVAGMGLSDEVTSPTYTIVNEYGNPAKIFHFDLYRLGHFEELEYIGMGDYLSAEAICIIEWPDKGDGLLPAADLICNIKINGVARLIEVVAMSQVGEKILQQL